MELIEIAPIEVWEKIAGDIYNKFGFNGTVYKRDNYILAKSEEWVNKVCPAIKAGDAIVICSSAQQRLSKIVQETKDVAVDECDAGFTKFLVPIFLNNDFIGMIGGCGCLSEKAEVDAFYVSKLLKKDDIKDLLPSVKQISENKLSEAIRFVKEQLQEVLRDK